jgi:DNA-directed RNA polymerase specialized sigma24 family protein
VLCERLIMGGKIGDYSGKGALGGWLRVSAVRTALNHLRTVDPALDVGDDLLALAVESDEAVLGLLDGPGDEHA